MTLMEMLLDAGYPRDQMFHHESDLYIFATSLTNRVIGAWCKDKGYNKGAFCKMFKDQQTGRPMYDVAFAYDPYWMRVGRN